MASVNQRIPNFLGGVSQQPDKIKFPGQLRVCDNAVPDITFGLKKRPPAEYIGTLNNANSSGHWYEILRDGDEKYIVQITPSNSGSMPIRVWDLADGTEKSLTNSNGDSIFNYLSGATAPYAVTTIQDYTLIANPDKVVATSTATTPAPLHSGNYAYARLDTIAYNTEYVLYDTTVSNPPSPNKYFRVTSLKVDYIGPNGLAGSTWGNPDASQQFAASSIFSFSGGDDVTLTSPDSNVIVNGQNITEGIEGTLQVNGFSYIANNTPNYDGSGTAASNFLGYTQDYDNRYTATITLKNGGLIRTTSKATAESLFIKVTTGNGTSNVQNYRISVEAVEEVSTYRDVSGIGYFKTPKNPDEGILSMSTILEGLKDSINDGSSGITNVTAEVVGSGLFLHGTSAKSINFLGGAVNENMSVIATKAQDISRLPAMNKHGYIAQVANTSELETDDYYVEFIADNFNGSNASTASGTGSYEETIRPHNYNGTSADQEMKLGLDPSTMPHALINNRNGTFTFVKLDETTANSQNNENYWKDRQVGDNESNPFPTIVGKKITEMFFHRNRLGLIDEEQLVMSQPGSYFNLFIVSAIAASDDNPIDISVSDVKPAFINHTLPINKGIMMFSDNGQFLLFTESDIFSPKTVRLKKLSSYECDSTIQPVDLGTSILFTSSVSAYSRAFEAVILDDDTPPQIIEQTRVVPEFLPKDITKSTNSAAIGITTYGKKGSTNLYHYKYYNADNKREQSSWYTWTLLGTLQHMFYTGGNFFTVTFHDSEYKLTKHEYVTDTTANRSYTITDNTTPNLPSGISTSRAFEAHLDFMTLPTALNPSTNPDQTVVSLPYFPSTATNFYMVGLDGVDSNGESIIGVVKEADSVSGSNAIFNNILLTNAHSKIAVGYGYTTTIELPTYYLNLGQNAYDLDGDLRISGINFELGEGGPIDFLLKSPYAYLDPNGIEIKDIDDYTQRESGILSDSSNFNTNPTKLTRSVRVPIQRKNNKYILQISIDSPFSTALISASWDGIYHNKRHVRR